MGFSDYRTALVTGASSGIGAATVRRLRAEGLEVHALARDVRRLASLSAETGCRAGAVDVNDHDALMRLAGSAEFDVLVNNAGQSRRGNILEMASDDVDTLVDVNLRAVLHLTRLIATWHGEAQPWPRGQRLLDRGPLRLRRKRHDLQLIRGLSRDEGGHSFALAAIARRPLRHRRSRHRSLARARGDEHLPEPEHHRQSGCPVRRRLRDAPVRRHRRRHCVRGGIAGADERRDDRGRTHVPGRWRIAICEPIRGRAFERNEKWS
ncbi:hypothetical protein AB7M42_003737 [Bradyrhizobium diazoefficiens]